MSETATIDRWLLPDPRTWGRCCRRRACRAGGEDRRLASAYKSCRQPARAAFIGVCGCQRGSILPSGGGGRASACNRLRASTWGHSGFRIRPEAPYNGAMIDGAMNFFSLLVLGLFLGMRHATDADHIVAIATIVSRQRTMRGSMLIGAAWGVGHSITVMLVGGAIILFGVVIPPWLGLSMEFAVGLMLVLLGILTLTGLGRGLGGRGGRGHDHLHTHGDYVHRHRLGDALESHGHADDQTPLAVLDRSWLGGLPLYQWLRPFAVGLVHGLAGSAAIALLVVTIIRDPLLALAYLFLFGVGTVGGMMLITLLLVVPFALTSVNLPRFNWQLGVASGLISFAFGLFLIYDIGFAEGGLFSDNPVWQPH